MEIMTQMLFIVLSFYVVIVNIRGQPAETTDIESTLTINCSKPLPKFQPKSVENLILNCSSDIIYSQFLKLLNITSLRSLKLYIPPSKDPNKSLNSTQFENLSVERLTIDYEYYNRSSKEVLMPMSSNVIYVLDTVRELEISGFNVSAGKEILKDNYTKCANIISLKITTSNVQQIPLNWLEQCKQLISLYLSRMRQLNGSKEVRRKLFAGLTSLRTLQIQNCDIEELGDELEDLVNLEKLNVAYNQIQFLLINTVLPSLVDLDLTKNHIFSSALFSSGVVKQPRLRYLSLDYNPVFDMCDKLVYSTSPDDTQITWHKPLGGQKLNLPSMQRFSLRGTFTGDMCFAGMRMDKLEYFDLGGSRFTDFHFSALPKSKTKRLVVDVTGCPIKKIPKESFTEEHYKGLHQQELIVTGLNVTLNCDCGEHIWLTKAVGEGRLSLSGAVCEGGQDLTTISEDQLQCDKYECGTCTCRRFWQDNSTDVKCSGELDTIPKEVGLRRLYASGNLVENITAADLPKSLIYLDLSKNFISRMSEEATDELFSIKNRRMRFFGNPIICDCENKPFIKALKDHYSVVEDYNSLTCIDDNRFIRDVPPDELCVDTSRAFVTATAAIVASLVAVIALLAALYYRYGNTAKVYLYSKGLCLFCIREEEIDADRPFDAFVSFSHKDENFVVNDLLPSLENEPYVYKICVHYRNWIAGELIPTQINISVDKSRRTIIVLSKNFLESVWGLLEFRTAHLSALKEGRARLIIIILDDVLETGDLDGELKSYLRTNTYVKWGDPWFWDKIRYALPHKNIAVQDQNQTDNSEKTDIAALNTRHLDTAEFNQKPQNRAENREQQKAGIENAPQKPTSERKRKDLNDSGLQSTSSSSNVTACDSGNTDSARGDSKEVNSASEHADSVRGDPEEVNSAQLGNNSDSMKGLIEASRNIDAMTTNLAIEMEIYK